MLYCYLYYVFHHQHVRLGRPMWVHEYYSGIGKHRFARLLKSNDWIRASRLNATVRTWRHDTGEVQEKQVITTTWEAQQDCLYFNFTIRIQVILRRVAASVDFTRSWKDYQTGSGYEGITILTRATQLVR